MRASALVLAASGFIANWPASSLSVAATVTVGLADSMVRHDAYAEIPVQQRLVCHQPPTLAITAAGRERESTQVLLRSEENKTLHVAVARPVDLPADSLRVERLGFVWANNATSDPAQTRVFPIPCPSDKLRQGGCWVADPVLPLQNNTDVFLPAGLTVSLWITFAAPANEHVLGKTFDASLTIAGCKIALELNVQPFLLPLTPSLKNTVQLDVAHLHRCFPSEPEEATYRRYRQCLLR